MLGGADHTFEKRTNTHELNWRRVVETTVARLQQVLLLAAAAGCGAFAPPPQLIRAAPRRVSCGAARPRMSAAGDVPVDTIATMSSVDWDDRIGLQGKWPNADKGWKVEVEWKQTPFGAGLFAAQDIEPETVLRVGKNGKNLMQFRSVSDIERFCRGAQGSATDAEYRARIGYVSDYLWGFDPNADAQGYEVAGDPAGGGDARPLAPRFFGMWIPGNGLNHRLEPNTVYRPAAGGTDEGINLVSLCAIKRGEELFDDYRRHGRAPDWLLAFARDYKVSLNFAECNDFVLAHPSNGDS